MGGRDVATIASRYVFREALQAWVAVTVVLLLILVTSQFAQVLGDAASNRLPKEAVLQVMLLTSVQYLTILIPIGLFLSILLAMGRLYRDSEMYALMACGLGPGDLYRPLLTLAAALAVAAAWLALEGAPWAVRQVVRIGEETRARSDLRVMEAGRFVSLGAADAVVYAEAVTPDGHLRNVFVQRRDGAKVEVVVAEEAWQRDTADPGVKMLTFGRGRRYEGEPGSLRFDTIEFAEHGIPYSLPDRRPAAIEPEALPARALQAAGPGGAAELQWRISVPVMALVLAFLAVPLARSSPRQGRYAGMGAGVLIYICYANLLGAAKVWIERGKLPPVVGMWWVHALFLGVALAMAPTHRRGRHMNIVRGYLGRTMLRTTLLVLAVLLALGGFIEFVGQLDDLGTGGYGTLQGIAYALMKLPEMAFIMMPMAVLLGSLLGLGALANGSEMIALRAAGASPAALARAVLATGGALALFALALGLYLAPPLERYSRQYRTFAMHGPSGLAGAQSAWVRDGNTIMNMSRMGDPSSFGGVYLFRLGSGGELASVARADSAGIGGGREWTLNNFAETRFGDDGVTVRRERKFAELTGVSPELLSLTVVRAEALSGFALWRYIRYLRDNDLDSRRYESAFWGRIASAVAVAPMCVLALTFTFGQLRRAGTGARMVIGIVIGFAYFLVSRALADGGEVYDLQPMLVGWLPTVLLAAVTLAALLRAR